MRDTVATRVVLGSLLVISVALATIDSRSQDPNSPLQPVRDVAGTVLGPLEAGVATMARPVTGTAGALADADARRDQIAQLTAENTRLQVQLAEALARLTDANAARDLIAVGSPGGARLKLGHVIAANAVSGYGATLAIDLGRADGVVADSTVLAGAGLVGRVIEVGDAVSTVLLVTDPLSGVGVRLAGNREIGTAVGTGADLLRMTLFNRNARLLVGEQVVTAGSPNGRPYVAGVRLGEIVEVQQRPGGLGPVALVRPHARLTALDVVAVLVADATAVVARAPGSAGGRTIGP